MEGGIARLCENIRSGLNSSGMSVRVLSEASDDSVQGADEIRVTSSRPLRELAAYRYLANHRQQACIVGNWYPEGMLAVLAGVKKLAILAHGAELLPPVERWRRAPWAALQRKILTASEVVIANSRYTGELVKSVAPKARVVALPLAVDHRRFCPSVSGRSDARERFGIRDQLVVMTVARVHRFKGHETVFRALARLSPSIRQSVVYCIAGRGPDEEFLRARAEELGIAGNLRWLGLVSEPELASLYHACDLFVMCTEERKRERQVEGFGLAFLEAQASGVPVVGTRSGGIPDAVEPGRGGWLIAERDDAQLASVLESAARDSGLLSEQGRFARERVEREFTWEHYIRRFVDAIEPLREVS